MHKNCCHQSCSFWLRYAPNLLSAGASPRPHWRNLQRSPRLPNWYRGGAPRKGKEGERGKGVEGRGGKGKGGEGVPECPNPELASLVRGQYQSNIYQSIQSNIFFINIQQQIIKPTQMKKETD